MNQTQYFSVQKSGVIKGGNATYTVDTTTGSITYSGVLVLKFPFPNKKIGPATLTVDPKYFASDLLKKAGDTDTVGPVTFTVTLVHDTNEMDVSIAIKNSTATAAATLDTSEPILKVKNITASVAAPLVGEVLILADAVNQMPIHMNWVQKAIMRFIAG